MEIKVESLIRLCETQTTGMFATYWLHNLVNSVYSDCDKKKWACI